MWKRDKDAKQNYVSLANKMMKLKKIYTWYLMCKLDKDAKQNYVSLANKMMKLKKIYP